MRNDSISRREKEISYSSSSSRNPTLFPSTPQILHHFHHLHHHQPMAGKGEPKTVATTPVMTPPATLPAVNPPTPAAEATMEEVAVFVQPLAMIPAEGSSGGPVGATHRSADQPGRPTRERDIHRHCSAAWSPLPLKIAKSRARTYSLYRRPSKETPSPLRSIAKQLFKDGAATESPVLPHTARVAPVPQKSTPEAVQGATSTRTSYAQRKGAVASPSPKKARSQSSPAKPKDDVTLEGPTITDLTAMVQQLRLENRHLENQLAERKIEVEELRDDLRLLRRGLSAKMKRLFEATGHKDLY